MAAAALEVQDPANYEFQSPSLLSQQPVTDQGLREKRMSMDWVWVQRHLETRLGALRQWRYSWWSHWSVLAKWFLPRRYGWLVVANRMWKGSPINDQIIDSTGTLAVRTCAAGIWTGLTSPSRPWFELAVGVPFVELDAEGKAWIEDTQEKAYAVLNQSNFYTTMAQAFQDVVVFGTAPMIIYEDFQDVIRCYLPCTGEYYLAAGSRLSVDTLYREFAFTIAEIVEMFDISNCPQQVQKLWYEGGAALDSEMVVAHSIEPNFDVTRKDGTAIKVVPGDFTYREVYWLKGQQSDAPLSLKGFNSAPFMVARWSTISNDAYGRSPCMDALGDTAQIQLETKRKAEFIEKGVRPPMGADPVLKNEPSSIIAGQVTYMDTTGGRKGFFPLFEVDAQWLPALTADIDTVKARIERCLFVDLFMAITRMEGIQPRNELELTQRNLERLQELGPFVQMFENEFAGPAIKRVLDIMLRGGLLLPLPDSLRRVPLKISYVSIMKLAQSALETVAIKDVLNTGGLLSSAAQAAHLPDPLRIINLDDALRRVAEKSNFPITSLYTDDEVKEADKVRSQAQTQAQIPGMAAAAVNAAKTLSQTSLAPGSALTAGATPVPGAPV